MPTKCLHSSHPSNLQDRTSARLLTSPFHGGAESRDAGANGAHVVANAARKSPLSKHAAPCLRAMFCHVQSTITWLLTHSHDTSPSSAAAVCRGHFHSHDNSPSSAAAVCRAHSLIHMITAPYQRLPCVEDTFIHMITAPHQWLPCVEHTLSFT